MTLRTWCAALAGLALAATARADSGSLPSANMPTLYANQPWLAPGNSTVRAMGESQGRAVLPGKNRLLIVEPEQTTQTFVVPRTEVVDAQGHALPQDALHAGDVVHVDLDVTGNTAVARKVTILQREEPLPVANPDCVAPTSGAR
jgi:hypothetical protein